LGCTVPDLSLGTWKSKR